MRPGRRDFLRGAAVTAVGAATFAGVKAATRGSAAPPSGRAIEFAGPHQAGILTPQQQAASFISFDVIAESSGDLRELLRTLTGRIRFLTAGGRPAAEDVQAIAADSGTLGPVVPADGLTVTVGVGAVALRRALRTGVRKPAHLVADAGVPR